MVKLSFTLLLLLVVLGHTAAVAHDSFYKLKRVSDSAVDIVPRNGVTEDDIGRIPLFSDKDKDHELPLDTGKYHYFKFLCIVLVIHDMAYTHLPFILLVVAYSRSFAFVKIIFRKKEIVSFNQEKPTSTMPAGL